MARSLSLCKSRFTGAASSKLVSFRSQSSDRRPSHGGDLYEIDTSASQSPSDPLIQKLEDAVHRIFVRRSAPDWLPFVPGASYWVPPPGSGSQSHGIAQLVAKLANPLTDEESISTNSSHGWPSSDYFLKGFFYCFPIWSAKILNRIREEIDELVLYRELSSYRFKMELILVCVGLLGVQPRLKNETTSNTESHSEDEEG